MKLHEIFRMAVHALGANRLRTFLSVLGVVIGVASVVAMVSIGSGSQKQVTSRIAALGTNLIQIQPRASFGRGGRVSQDTTNVFTLKLAGIIKQHVPDLSAVVPTTQTSGLIAYGALNQRVPVVGVTPDYPNVVNYHTTAGRFVIDQDVSGNSLVAVLGSQVAQTLFGSQNPIGRQVGLDVNNRRLTLTIVGVMESKGQVFFSNFDGQIYLPITTVLHRINGSPYVDSYAASAVSAAASQQAADELDYFLYRYLGDASKFNVASQQSLLDTLNQTTEVLTLVLAAIAGISLVVGGIGVMNIMLVSVTERTREIGLRKAIGARRRHIVVQFLSEAALLGIAGGIIGVGLGVGGSLIISRFAGWPAAISVSAAALAFCFAALVGIISGVYPAVRASRLDPVLALRYE